MAGYPKNFKNCSVCDFWGGSREVDAFGKKSVIDSVNTKGKCLLKGGPNKGIEKAASHTCTKWSAWGALT
jgi:hypothetical protein